MEQLSGIMMSGLVSNIVENPFDAGDIYWPTRMMFITACSKHQVVCLFSQVCIRFVSNDRYSRFRAVLCYENNYKVCYTEVRFFVCDLLYPVVFLCNNRIVPQRVMSRRPFCLRGPITHRRHGSPSLPLSLPRHHICPVRLYAVLNCIILYQSSGQAVSTLLQYLFSFNSSPPL